MYQYAYNTNKLTILMQGNDIEMNPGPTHKSITTVQGNFQILVWAIDPPVQSVTNSQNFI